MDRITLNASATTKLIPGPLREVLLLERAIEAVETRSPDQTSRIRELAAAVDARLSAAESLAAGDQVAPALVILRDAAFLAAQAVLAARGLEGGPSPAEDGLQRIAELVEAGQLPNPPDGLGRALELLGDPNRLAFDELRLSVAIARRLEVETTVNWLRSLVEPRSLAQIKLSRTLRLGFLGLVVIGSIVGFIGWGANRLFSPKNLAFGKSVQLSSRRPNCGAAGPEGMPPSGLVDGSKSAAYDICTSSEVGPWAIVDLGQVHALAKAKVYNRDDCCWGQYELPTVFEISVDGKEYTEIARQTTAFTTSSPWTVPIGGRPARFVRLRVDSREPRELVLNELEVFGR